MNTSMLSQKAQKQVDALQQQIQDLVQADKTREPKLTADEQAEVAELEETQKRYAARYAELKSLDEEKHARLEHLKLYQVELVLDGGDPVELARELESLKVETKLLWDAMSAALSKSSQAEVRINLIKIQARKREVQNG